MYFQSNTSALGMSDSFWIRVTGRILMGNVLWATDVPCTNGRGASSAERGEEKDKGEGERNIFRGKKNIKEKKTERVRRKKRKISSVWSVPSGSDKGVILKGVLLGHRKNLFSSIFKETWCERKTHLSVVRWAAASISCTAVAQNWTAGEPVRPGRKFNILFYSLFQNIQSTICQSFYKIFYTWSPCYQSPQQVHIAFWNGVTWFFFVLRHLALWKPRPDLR